ncbi:unnamed protein product, partial [Ixodes persulcatus]
MYALVRVLNDHDRKIYTIPVTGIREFNPANAEDFDSQLVYSAFWDDPDSEETSVHYPAQILMIAETEDALREKQLSKRIRKARIHASEYENEEGSEPEQVKSQSTVSRKWKAEQKKQKEQQQAAKSKAYVGILKAQLENVKQENKEGSGITAPKKYNRNSYTDESGTDDCLVASSELALAKKDAGHWRQRYKEKCQQNARLHEIIKSQQACVDGKLLSMHRLLEEVRDQPLSKARLLNREQPQNKSQALKNDQPILDVAIACSDERASPAGSNAAWVLPPSPDVAKRLPPVVDRIAEAASSRTPSGSNGEHLVQNQRMELPRAAYECSPGAPNFNPCGNGRFHLKDGVTISEVQAENIFDPKKNKPALAVKEIAQAPWGSEVLAQRTDGGKVAPKDRNNPDAKPRKEHSPDKEMAKKIDVAPALANLSTILSEKNTGYEKRHEAPGTSKRI